MVRKGKRQKSQVREWTEAIILAFLIAMFIRTFVVQAFKIPSSSMVPTLEVGDHILSGAVFDPRAMAELMPDFATSDGPFQAQVGSDKVVYLSKSGSFTLPITPPPLSNHGKYVMSLSDLTRWLAPKVEEKGVQIFPGFPGASMLYDGDRVDEEALPSILAKATNINLVGDRCIGIAMDNGFVNAAGVIRIEGVPHAMVFYI